MKITKEMDLIYKRYYRDVYGFCVRLCEGHPEMAEDICQETFFKALKNADSFRGDSKILSWLCQIAKNTYISHLRKEKHLLKTKDMEGAKTVLAASFADVRREGEYIRVYDVDDTESIVDLLMKSGHVVNEIKKNKIGLEEYYIELMSQKEVK